MNYPRRFLILLVLLLVPLFALKWRVDHPPLSQGDQVLRRALNQASEVRLSGYGSQWGALSGLKREQTFIVKDQAALSMLIESLRSTSRTSRLPPSHFVDTHLLAIYFSVHTSDAKRPWETFLYWRNADGASLYWIHSGVPELKDTSFIVQPRFVPRFEALIAHLAQRAKAPGHHPEITLKPSP